MMGAWLTRALIDPPGMPKPLERGGHRQTLRGTPAALRSRGRQTASLTRPFLRI
jgi:hypothetical protein